MYDLKAIFEKVKDLVSEKLHDFIMWPVTQIETYETSHSPLDMTAALGATLAVFFVAVVALILLVRVIRWIVRRIRYYVRRERCTECRTWTTSKAPDDLTEFLPHMEPLCPSCQHQLRQQLRPIQICGQCNMKMDDIEADNVSLHECPECHCKLSRAEQQAVTAAWLLTHPSRKELVAALERYALPSQ